MDAPRSVEHWIRELPPGLDVHLRCLMYTLSTFRNRKTGRCDPSAATLATALGVHEKTIRRWMKDLENHGVISRTLMRSRYQINFNFAQFHSDIAVSESKDSFTRTSESFTRTSEALHSDIAVSTKPYNPNKNPRGGGFNSDDKHRQDWTK